MQLLVAGLCLLLSLRVLHRPWYDSIVWLITLPLAYFVKNIVKDLLRRDPEVRAAEDYIRTLNNLLQAVMRQFRGILLFYECFICNIFWLL